MIVFKPRAIACPAIAVPSKGFAGLGWVLTTTALIAILPQVTLAKPIEWVGFQSESFGDADNWDRATDPTGNVVIIGDSSVSPTLVRNRQAVKSALINGTGPDAGDVTVTKNATLSATNGTTVAESGHLTSLGKIDGDVKILDDGLVEVEGKITGAVNNSGKLVVTGDVTGVTKLTNSGDIVGAGTVNADAFTQTGGKMNATVDARDGSTLTGGTIGGTLDGGETIVTKGEVKNTGTIATHVTVKSDGTLDTKGIIRDGITNNGTVNAEGLIGGVNDNKGLFTLTGDAKANADFTNAGTLDTGKSNLNGVGVLTNTGTISGEGTVTATSFAQNRGDMAATVKAKDGSTLTGGTISGTLEGGTATVASGTVKNSGTIATTVTVDSGATLTTTTTGAITGRVTNDGTLVTSGATRSGITNNATVDAKGILGGSNLNTATGTFTLTGDAKANDKFTNVGTLDTGTSDLSGVTKLTNSGTISGDGVVNATTFEQTGGVMDATVNARDGSKLTGGTISGTLDGGMATVAAGTVTNSGSISTDVTVKAGATLTTTGIVRDGITNNGTVNAEGTIGGTNDNHSLFTLTGDARANGAFKNGGTLDTGTSDLSGVTDLTNTGTITGTGTINSDTFTQDRGDMAATVDAKDGSTLTGGTITGTLEGGRATVKDGRVKNLGTIATTVTVKKDATLTTAGTISGRITNNGAVKTTGIVTAGIINNGTLDAKGSISGGINNSGTVDAGGTGTITGGVNNSGTFNTAATISGGIINSGTVNAQGTISGANLNKGDGTFTLTGNVTADDTFTNAGTLDIGAFKLSGVDGLINSGIISGTGTINTTTFSQDRGNMAATVIASDVSTLTGGTISGTLKGGAATVISGAGSVVKNAGTISTLTTSIEAGATLVQQTGAKINGTLTNLGTIATENGQNARIAADLNGAGGTLDVAQDSHLTFGGSFGGSGTVATLDLTKGSIVVTKNGVLSGTTLNFVLDDSFKTGKIGNVVLVRNAASDFTLGSVDGADGSGATVSFVTVDKNNNVILRTVQNPGIDSLAANLTLTEQTLSSLINRPVSPFSLVSDSNGSACRPGTFARAVIGDASVKSDAPAQGGLSNKSSGDYTSFQLSADYGCYDSRFNGWSLVFGLTAGANNGNSAQQQFKLDEKGNNLGDAGTLTTNFNQSYGGLYVSGRRNQLSADVQLRFAKSDYKFKESEDNIFGPASDPTLTSNALSLNTRFQYNIALKNGWGVAPSGGVSLTHVTAGSIKFDEFNSLDVGDYDSTVVFGGATFTKALPETRGGAGQAISFGANYYDDLDGKRTSQLNSSKTIPTPISSTSLGGFGELSVGYTMTKGLDSVFGKPGLMFFKVEGSVRVGQHVTSASSLTAQFRLVF